MIRRWLHRFAAWLFTVTVPLPPSHEVEVRDAVRDAFVECGLPLEQFSDDFDLARAGKLNEVLIKAGRHLGQDPEFSTVGDVVKWFCED